MTAELVLDIVLREEIQKNSPEDFDIGFNVNSDAEHSHGLKIHSMSQRPIKTAIIPGTQRRLALCQASTRKRSSKRLKEEEEADKLLESAGFGSVREDTSPHDALSTPGLRFMGCGYGVEDEDPLEVIGFRDSIALLERLAKARGIELFQ